MCVLWSKLCALFSAVFVPLIVIQVPNDVKSWTVQQFNFLSTHTHTRVEDTLNLIEPNRTVNRWTFGYNERITLLLLTVLRNKVFTHYKHTHTSHTHPTICSAQNSFGNEFSQFVCCVSIVSFRSRLNCITRTCDCQMAPFGKNAPKWMPMQRCVNWNWKSHFANRSGEPSIFLRLFLLFLEF